MVQIIRCQKKEHVKFHVVYVVCFLQVCSECLEMLGASNFKDT